MPIFSSQLDESDDDNGETQVAKRARLDEQTLMKRRERRLWEENRKRILFEYVQFSYYSRSVRIFSHLKFLINRIRALIHNLFLECNSYV